MIYLLLLAVAAPVLTLKLLMNMRKGAHQPQANSQKAWLLEAD